MLGAIEDLKFAFIPAITEVCIIVSIPVNEKAELPALAEYIYLYIYQWSSATSTVTRRLLQSENRPLTLTRILTNYWF